MKLSIFVKVLLLWLFLRSTLAGITVYQREGHGFVEERNSSPAFISCDYEVSQDMSSVELLPADISGIRDMLDGSNSILNVYKIPDSQRGRVDFDQCELCSFHSIKCTGNVTSDKDYVCFRKSMYKGKRQQGNCEKHVMKIKGFVEKAMKQSSDKVIKQEEEEISLGNQTDTIIRIPIGGRRERSIQSRSVAGYCAVPSSMSTASVSCRSYPSRVVCLQRCAFGYTLDNGIQERLECIKKEGVWKPGKFKECKPFVDCTLSLSSGGSVSCSVNNVFEAPECRVSCLHYEDKEAVESQTYVCNIEGKWDPPLPFCVIPGSGMLLTKAPQIKLHENLKKK